MAVETFDLADAISKLLVRLREFRRKLKAAQPIIRQLRLVIKRHSSAVEERAVLFSSPLPEQEPERRKGRARRAQLSSKVKKLRQALADRSNQHQASTAFIEPFQNEVELVLQRLPLKPEWQRFPYVIRSLLIAIFPSYQKMFPIQDLDTLEIRLREMLDLAKTNAKTTSSSGDNTLAGEKSIRDDGIGRASCGPFTREGRGIRTAPGDDTLDFQRSKADALEPGADLPVPPTAAEVVWAASTNAAPGSSPVPTPAQNPAPVEAATAKEPAQHGDPDRDSRLVRLSRRNRELHDELVRVQSSVFEHLSNRGIETEHGHRLKTLFGLEGEALRSRLKRIRKTMAYSPSEKIREVNRSGTNSSPVKGRSTVKS